MQKHTIAASVISFLSTTMQAARSTSDYGGLTSIRITICQRNRLDYKRYRTSVYCGMLICGARMIKVCCLAWQKA